MMEKNMKRKKWTARKWALFFMAMRCLPRADSCSADHAHCTWHISLHKQVPQKYSRKLDPVLLLTSGLSLTPVRAPSTRQISDVTSDSKAVGEMAPLWRVSDWPQRKAVRQAGSEPTSGGESAGPEFLAGSWAEGIAGLSACSQVKPCETCSLGHQRAFCRAKARAHLRASDLTTSPPTEGGCEVFPGSSSLFSTTIMSADLNWLISHTVMDSSKKRF